MSKIPIVVKRSELTVEQFKHSNIVELVKKHIVKQNKVVNQNRIVAGVQFAYKCCCDETSTNHFAQDIIYYKMKEKSPETPASREYCTVTMALDKILEGKGHEVELIDVSESLKVSTCDEFVRHPGISQFFNKTYISKMFPERIEEMRDKWPETAVKFYEHYKVDKPFQRIIHEIIKVYESHQTDTGTEEINPPASQIEENVIEQSQSEVSPEAPQIEEAFLLEQTLFSQNTQQVAETNSPDPLMSSIAVKPEPDLNFSSYENSVFIIDQAPDEPILIEDSFRVQPSSQIVDSQ